MPRYRLHLHDGHTTPAVTEVIDVDSDEAETLSELGREAASQWAALVRIADTQNRLEAGGLAPSDSPI